MRPKCSRSSVLIKTCIEKITGPFESVKVPKSEKYEKQGFLPGASQNHSTT
jgi:hypothetical protein